MEKVIKRNENNLMNNLDFYLIDSFENIKNLETAKTLSSQDTIYLFYFDNSVKQNIFKKKDLEKIYNFITLFINKNYLGILFPKEKYINYMKTDIGIEKYLLQEIQKSNLVKEMKFKIKIDLRENKFILKKSQRNIDNNNEYDYLLEFKISVNNLQNIDNNTEVGINNKINEEVNINNNQSKDDFKNENKKLKNFMENNNNKVYNYNKNDILKNNNNVNNNNNNVNLYYFSTIGLNNIGSTCYMNSSLQCLIHVNELVIYFLNEYPNDNKILLNKNKNVKSGGEISKAFYNLIYSIYKIKGNTNNNCNLLLLNSKTFQKNKLKINSLNPIEFKLKLGLYNSQFRNFEANDSKDLIIYLLTTIHEELNYLGDNPPLKINQPSQLDQQLTFCYFNTIYNNQNLSKISTIFYGTYENTTICSQCKNIYYNFQKFECISFGMQKYNKNCFNIYDGFKDNEQPQKLDGNNQFFCNICNKSCEGEIACKIFMPPNKLLINIDYGHNKKYKPSKIEFDEEIDITKYVHFNFGYKIKYKIIGVCSHYGSSGKFGHYIAYCKNRETNIWYQFNDSICKQIKNGEYKLGSPYLLLYELKI